MSCIFSVREISFCSFVRMPVYCIAYGYDNDQRSVTWCKFSSLATKETFAVETGKNC